MVEYDEDSDTIDKAVYPHPEGEIWQIRCSVINAAMFTTSHAKGVLWCLQMCYSPVHVHKYNMVQ